MKLSEKQIDEVAKKYCGMGGVEDYRSFANEIIVIAHPSEPAVPPVGGAAPTDATAEISERLRAAMANCGPGALLEPLRAMILTAADECDRFYGGMMAWKKTAQKKDRDWNEERMARVNERCAQRAAAPVSGGELQSEALAQFTEYFVKNYPADTIIGDPNWHAPRVYRAAVAAHDKAIDAITTLLRAAWAERDELRAAVAAAKVPTSQPAAYVNGDELDNMLDDRTATIQSNPSGYRKTPLYAAPVEQDQGAGAAPVGGALVATDHPGLRSEIESLKWLLGNARRELEARYAHDKGDVWHWQGDGSDNLESMGSGMVVVIHADQLRKLAAPAGALEAIGELQDFGTLRSLAFRTLWLAYVWNDHNFKAAHLEARETCGKLGIRSLNEANAWLDKMDRAAPTTPTGEE